MAISKRVGNVCTSISSVKRTCLVHTRCFRGCPSPPDVPTLRGRPPLSGETGDASAACSFILVFLRQKLTPEEGAEEEEMFIVLYLFICSLEC